MELKLLFTNYFNIIEFHLSMMEKFNKKEYNVNYRKEQLKRKVKAQFNTDLFYNEKVELDKLLSDLGMTKREFILEAKKNFERKREKMEKLKEITWEELGVYIGNKVSEEFKKEYSKDIRDYHDMIASNGNNEYLEEYSTENTCMYRVPLEFTKVGEVPLIVEFYEENINDENDNIIDTKYYIENYETKYLKNN